MASVCYPEAALISFCYLAVRWVLALAKLRVRSNDFKELEIVVLRHELAILKWKKPRRRMTWNDRFLLAGASRLLPRSRVRQRARGGHPDAISCSAGEWLGGAV
jgi:hypothetical protein